MKFFRYPINFYTSDINSLCVDICSFLGCSEFLFDSYQIPIGNSFLIAPIRKFIAKNPTKLEPEFTRFGVSQKFIKKIEQVKNINRLVARGYYVPHTYSYSSLPILTIYKQMSPYGNKPIIISENSVRPGEFILVPENIEVLATLSFYDEMKDSYNDLPDELIGISFFCQEDYTVNYFLDVSDFDNKKTLTDKAYSFIDFKPYNLEKSFFEGRTTVKKIFTEEFQFTQIFPILNQQLHEQLLHDIVHSTLWVKRHSDNYIQMSLDIFEMSKLSNCPSSIIEVIDEIKKSETIKAISKISGISVKYVNEIYAFKMQPGEFIDFHEDNPMQEKLLVRFNWLLQVPSDRTHDLRFKKNETVYCCQSLPNSATIFRLGEQTPHDVSLISWDADCDRINIILTFGN